MNKTKVISFIYTKDNGEVSNRTGITLGYSSPKLALIADITEWDGDARELKAELGRLRSEYLADVAELLEDYGVQQKTFKLCGIADEKEVQL